MNAEPSMSFVATNSLGEFRMTSHPSSQPNAVSHSSFPKRDCQSCSTFLAAGGLAAATSALACAETRHALLMVANHLKSSGPWRLARASAGNIAGERQRESVGFAIHAEGRADVKGDFHEHWIRILVEGGALQLAGGHRRNCQYFFSTATLIRLAQDPNGPTAQSLLSARSSKRKTEATMHDQTLCSATGELLLQRVLSSWRLGFRGLLAPLSNEALLRWHLESSQTSESAKWPGSADVTVELAGPDLNSPSGFRLRAPWHRPLCQDLTTDLPRLLHPPAPTCQRVHLLARRSCCISPSLSVVYVPSLELTISYKSGMTPARTGNDDTGPVPGLTPCLLINLAVTTDLPTICPVPSKTDFQYE